MTGSNGRQGAMKNNEVECLVHHIYSVHKCLENDSGNSQKISHAQWSLTYIRLLLSVNIF